MRAALRRHGRRRRDPGRRAAGRAVNGDALRLPFPDARLRPGHRLGGAWSTSPTTPAPPPSWPGCCARAAPWPSPCRRGCPSRCAGRCRTSTTPPSCPAATSASTPRPTLRRRLRDAGLRPGGAHHAHAPALALLVAAVRGRASTNDEHPLVRAYHRLLVWDIVAGPLVTRLAERCLSPVLGKSLVVYARKPAVTEPHARRVARRAQRRPTWPPRVDTIAAVQLPDGHDPVVPRRPRRPVEPRRGGHGPRPRRATRPRPSAAYEWLVGGAAARRLLAPVLPGRPRRGGQARRQRVRLRRHRRVAPLAAHRRPRASSRRCGRSSSAAIDFVLELQTPRGEIRWARHADGTPWSYALLTGSSSICHSLRCAIAIAERARPRAPRLGAVGGLAGPRRSATCPRPSTPRTAGRWTGTTRCWPAWSPATTGRERLRGGWDTFVMEGRAPAA